MSKLCPIRRANLNTVHITKQDGDEWAVCIGEKCAWWDKYAGRCAVAVPAAVTVREEYDDA